MADKNEKSNSSKCKGSYCCHRQDLVGTFTKAQMGNNEALQERQENCKEEKEIMSLRRKHILKKALADEKGAQKMYSDLSKTLPKKSHKKAVATIKKDERKHKKMLLKIKKELTSEKKK